MNKWPTPTRPQSMAEMGTEMYRAHFGRQYAYSESAGRNPTDALLFGDDFYSPFHMDIQGKSVAIVGNAKVRNFGRQIDSHDVVARINYPYNWRQDYRDDGEKFTHWVGLGKVEVFKPSLFHNPHSSFVPVDLGERLASVRQLHCLSHHHVESGFWDEVQDRGLTEKLRVHFASPVVFDEIEPTAFGKDRFLLSLITSRAYLDSGYGGWYTWEILFTGIRALLLVAMSSPASMSIYGMNFFSDGERSPWDMHKLDLNREAYAKILWNARNLGIDVREDF